MIKIVREWSKSLENDQECQTAKVIRKKSQENYQTHSSSAEIA